MDSCLQESLSNLVPLHLCCHNPILPGWARLAQARAASRPGLCAIAPGRRAGAPPLWQLARSFPVTGPQPDSSLRRAGNRASRPGHRPIGQSRSHTMPSVRVGGDSRVSGLRVWIAGRPVVGETIGAPPPLPPSALISPLSVLPLSSLSSAVLLPLH